MKKHINEIKRMQQLAGIIKENINEVEGDMVTFRRGRSGYFGDIDGIEYEIIPVNHIEGDEIQIYQGKNNPYLVGIVKGILDNGDYQIELTSKTKL